MPDQRYGTGNGLPADKRKCLTKAKQAYALLQAGKYPQALERYEHACGCLPRHPAIWNDRGVTLYKLDRTADAKACFVKATELDADYALGWRNRAVVAWENNEYATAMEYAVKAAKLTASDKNLRYAARACALHAFKEQGAERRRLLQRAVTYLGRMQHRSAAVERRLARLRRQLEP